MAWTTVWFAAGCIVAVSAVLVMIGLRNPRVMLQDYPKDVQAAVPPKTEAEKRETVWWAILLVTLFFGAPLGAAIALKLQQPDSGFPEAALTALAVLVVFNLWDWLIVDWLIFCTITPRFMVIPGTEGLAGYRDYGLHFRGFLIGIALSLVASLAIGLITLLVPG
jgi:hypothetical protein